MNQKPESKIESKIHEDLSPTRNLTGLHLKIVATIAIIWSLFQLCDKSKFKKLKNSYYHSERDKDVIKEWELT